MRDWRALIYLVPSLLTLAAVGLLAGGALVAVGVRGRRVGDHPHCRRCGFDLHGLPVGFGRCPECGATVETAGGLIGSATRTGRRERRRRAIGWGVVLGGPGVVWLGLLGATVVPGLNATAHSPAWLLERQAGLSSYFGGPAAAAELERRYSAGALSDAAVKRIAAGFLDDQADAALPWVAAKGDFIESARSAGLLTEAQWQRYGEGAFAPAVSIRPKARAGQGLPINLETGVLRLGSASMLRLDGRWCLTDGAGEVAAELDQRGSSITGSKGFSTTQFMPLPADCAGVAGRTLALRLDYLGGGTGSPVPAGSRVMGTVDLTPAERPTAVGRASAEMAAAVRPSLVVSASAGPSGNYLIVNLTRQASPRWPLPAAWEVWVRHKGQEHKAGTIAVPAGQCAAGWGVGYDVSKAGGPPLDGVDRVDVILRPSAAAAERTVDLTEFWDGGLEFVDVPLRHD